VKAGGNIVVLPPSLNPRTGRRYEFVEGRFDEEMLRQLQRFNAEAALVGKSKTVSVGVEEGRRDKWAWAQCMKDAHSATASMILSTSLQYGTKSATLRCLENNRRW
jgi:hypothetical protein